MEFLNHDGLKEYHKKIQAQLSKISLDPSELVSDSTKELFNLPSTATLDDILKAINNSIHYEQSGKVAIYITAKTTSGTPIPDAMITGVETLSGQPVFTDASGTAIGYATLSSGSTTLSIKNHVDLNDVSVKSSVNNSVHSATLTTTTRNFLSITSSASYYCSGLLKRIDVSCGGGGGGSSGTPANNDVRGGNGGGGGYAAIKENVVFTTRHEYLAQVGSSGKAGTGYRKTGYVNPTAGGSGGTTSFFDVVANGGSGGGSRTNTRASGNGQGGWTRSASGVTSSDIANTYPSGTNGSGSIYASLTTTKLWGGGGGAGASDYTSQNYTAYIPNGTGGSPGGGTGANARWNNSSGTNVSISTSPTEAKNGGGAGAHAGSYTGAGFYNMPDGLKGAPGEIAIRMYF